MNRRATVLILVAVVCALFVGTGHLLAAENSLPPVSETPNTVEETGEPIAKKIILKTERIDKAGEKIGYGIDLLSEKVADFLGDWVNIKVFSGITWIKLLFCLSLIFVVVLVERSVTWFILKKTESVETVEGAIPWRRIFYKAVLKPLRLFIWVYGIYGAMAPLYVHFQTAEGLNVVHGAAKTVSNLGGTAAIFWFLYGLVALLDARLIKWATATESTIDDILAPLVGKTMRIFIIIIAGIVILQNITGLKIGPLVASLGIGGLAVALAAKESIANFFGTLTILFDKPFQVGDRVILDKYDGNVENVGFRSTRIRLLSGHLVTIPNEKVVNSGVENIARRPFIKWMTNIGVTYDTPPEKVEKATQIIKDIIANHEGMKEEFPPRVYFNGFNESSLNIQIIIWYHPPNYWDLQAWVQNTCLEIMRRFEAEDIDFAFPTRTLYMANDDKRQLQLKLLSETKN